jgi:hypothetical protein
MKITLKNNFHNSEAVVIAKDGYISPRQAKDARNKLCGISGCTCGDSLGCRGPQDVDYQPVQDDNGKVEYRVWSK